MIGGKLTELDKKLQTPFSFPPPECFEPGEQHADQGSALMSAQPQDSAIAVLQEVPGILKSLPNWVSWKLVSGSKVPFVCGTRQHASSTDPTTWTTFEKAAENAVISNTEGIGFVIDGEAIKQQLVGFDLDGCRNPETGELAPWAEELLDRIPSYTEYTPSGYGLRIWVRGKLPGSDRVFNLDPKVGFGDKVKVEVFDHARYFTVTGKTYYSDADTIDEFDLKDVYLICQQLRDKFPASPKARTETEATRSSVQFKLSGTTLTTKLELMMHGTVTSRTPFVIEDGHGNSAESNSQSEMDLSLATQLAIKHGDNPDLIDDDFRKSSLYREKWERKDYSENTINRAIRTAAKMQSESDQKAITNTVESDSVTGFEHELSTEEYESQLEQEWPVIPLKPQPGPEWTDAIYYGLAGDIVRKASQFNEAHPAGMLLDLLVSLGSMFGRSCYFNINSTRHYSNEFMARVGDSSYSRKGGGRDEIDRLLKQVDKEWFNNRTISGFGSSEAIIAQVKDTTVQQRFDKKSNGFIDTVVPGVNDKRLCIREGELASVFLLAGKAESRADVVLRDGWDSKPLKNVVKGKNQDGISNSAGCQEPHISISGDTTRSELVAKMPDGADDNGFGNRFLYTYVYRVQLCPLGGPEIDWANEISKLYDVIHFAQQQGCVGLTSSAKNTWMRMYLQIENNHLPGLAGKMTSRAAAHIRRLALIYAMLDQASSVDVKHLRAAQALWDYAEDSAQFIFNGTTKGQIKLLQWLEKQQQPVTLSNVREDFYQKHLKAERVKSIVADLVQLKRIQQTGDTYQIVKR